MSQWDATTITQLNTSLQMLTRAAKNLSFKGTVTLKDKDGNEVGSGTLEPSEYGRDGE